MRGRAFFLAALLLALELTYVVGTGVFLNRGYLLGLLNTSEDLKIEYQGAWSWFPGLVHIRGLRLRVQDSNLQLHFSLDKVRVEVALTPLLRQVFQTREIVADGLDFRLRMKRARHEHHPRLHRELPEIPGLPDFEKEEKPKRAPGPWRIDLANIRISNIRQVWIDTIRFQGRAEVKGGFELRPARGATVYPARLVLHEGEISLNAEPAVKIISAKVEGKIERFLTEQAGGWDIFRFISGRLRLHGDLKSLAFTNRYFHRISWLRLSGGDGTIRTDARLDRGRLHEESLLVIKVRELIAHLWKQRARGAAEVTWRVEKKELGALDLRLDDFRLERNPLKGETESPRIEGRLLELGLRTRELHLAEAFGTPEIKLSIPQARITDFRYFNAYLPSKSSFKLEGGEGEIQGALSTSGSMTGEKDRGFVHVTGKGAGARFDRFKLRGDIEAKLQLNSGNMEGGSFDIDGSSVQLTDIKGGPAGKTIPPDLQSWWGNVLLSDGTLRLRDPVGIEATVDVRARDARPVFALFASEGDLPGWLSGVLAFGGLTATAKAEVSDDTVKISKASIQGKGTSLMGWFLKNEDITKGRLLLNYGPFSAGFGLVDDQTTVRLQDAAQWFHTASPFPE